MPDEILRHSLLQRLANQASTLSQPRRTSGCLSAGLRAPVLGQEPTRPRRNASLRIRPPRHLTVWSGAAALARCQPPSPTARPGAASPTEEHQLFPAPCWPPSPTARSGAPPPTEEHRPFPPAIRRPPSPTARSGAESRPSSPASCRPPSPTARSGAQSRPSCPASYRPPSTTARSGAESRTSSTASCRPPSPTARSGAERRPTPPASCRPSSPNARPGAERRPSSHPVCRPPSPTARSGAECRSSSPPVCRPPSPTARSGATIPTDYAALLQPGVRHHVRHESHLVLGMPAPAELICTEPGCTNRFRSTLWRNTRLSLQRHLRLIHHIEVSFITVCLRCSQDLGLRPSRHVCKHSDVVILPPPPLRSEHQCNQCHEQFSTKRALTNHHKWHVIDQMKRDRDAAIALPQPDTRQARRRRAATRGCASPTQAQGITETAPLPSARQAESTQTTPSSPNPDASLQVAVLDEQPASSSESALTTCCNPPASQSTPQIPDSQPPSSTSSNTPCEPDSGMEGEGEPTGNEGFIGDIDGCVLEPDDRTLVHQYLPELQRLSRDQPSDERWNRFEEILGLVTDLTAELVKLPPAANRNVPTRAVDTTDAQYIQKLYRRNRRRAIRLIVNGESRRCPVETNQVEDHYRRLWTTTECDTSLYVPSDLQRPPVDLTPFTAREVTLKLRGCENSAPGDDRLTYRHWQSVDPSGVLITAILNVCLLHKRIPAQWRSSATILIHKKGDPMDLSNYRPICLSRTIYKLYAGCLTRRLSEWTIKHNALSQCQKGFLPHDGVFEHQFAFEQRMLAARTDRKDFCAAFLDVSNAFGSIPHSALSASLSAAGTGDAFVSIIRDLYSDHVSTVLTAEGPTPPIPVQSGVRQGCPLSGMLFNFAVDPIIRAIQGADPVHQVLAFADDLTPLDESPTGLQRKIDTIVELASTLNLTLNPQKCCAVHISGRNPVGCRDTSFKVNGRPIPSLKDGETWKFLGKPVGFQILSDWTSLKAVMDVATDILQSRLAPWQRIDALKAFFFPSIQYGIRTGQFTKADWKKLDHLLRPELKRTLNLPQETSNDYLYGSRAAGACGIPCAADDSDVLAVDGAFKLLTSRDNTVRDLAHSDLLSTVGLRLRRPVENQDLTDYLSCADRQDFAVTKNERTNSWTNARKASRRLPCEWRLENGSFQITHQSSVIREKQRQVLVKIIRGNIRIARSGRLSALPNQGKVMECVGVSKASSHFMTSGSFTRFADWRFIHRARLNLVPLNANRRWVTGGDKSCRRCNHRLETLPHVLNHCMSYAAAYQRRHNAIVDRIRKASSLRFRVVGDNQAIVEGSRLRPDLVLVRQQSAMIVDVTVPFDNRLEAFEKAREAKIEKYQPLVESLKRNYADVSIVPFIVGSLGSWDAANDPFMKRLCSASYGRLMKKLCVSDTIKWSRDIYIQHLTGQRQYE